MEPDHPELYLDSTLRHSLNLVLPATVRQGLNLGASYDRWTNRPTLNLDYFLPVKAWNDKSIFFNPRVSLTGSRESLSMGAGIRHLLTAETLVGFHAFHDWTRSRGMGGEWLKEAGAGIEFSALPGRYSDLKLQVNAYMPINEKLSMSANGESIVRESLSGGWDARLSFLLPSVVDWLDMRVDARGHSYFGGRTDNIGYTAGLSFTTRDGLLRASIEHERRSSRSEDYKMEATITLEFDWKELLEERNPFSAPYRVPNKRYSRKIRDGLYERVTRKHELPTNRTENRIVLATRVSENSVFFSGGFPDLPNSRLTAQIAQSPWKDSKEVITNSSGNYSGKLDLPPGTYRFRLIHKPTGRSSEERTIVIHDN